MNGSERCDKGGRRELPESDKVAVVKQELLDAVQAIHDERTLTLAYKFIRELAG